MPDTKIPQYQQELFTEFTPSQPSRGDRLPGIAKPQKPILMSLTIEQILLAGIGLILLCCFSFFMGVLRGKSIASTIAPTVPQTAVSPRTQPMISVPAAKPFVISLPKKTLPPVIKTPLAAAPKKNSFVSDLSKPYTIQLVTYKQKELGEKEVAYFRSKGYYATLVPHGDYFIVCLGQYTNKEEAKKDLALFAAKYKDCFLRRR